MTVPDWTKPTERRWVFDFQLIPPNKLNDRWGSLEKVDVSSVSITEGYYTDTRIQSKMTYYDVLSADRRQAYIRIVAKDTTTGYTENLGTFIPTSDDVTMEDGVQKTTVNLESILYGISMQKLQTEWVSKTGVTAYTNLINILINKCAMSYSSGSYTYNFDKHGAYSGKSRDVQIPQSAMCEAGKSILELMYGICNYANLRLDVDGSGRVLWYPYDPPSTRSPIYTITVNSEDSIVLDGVTRSSNYLEMASQVTVHAKNDEEKEYRSTQTATGRLSLAQRGYIVGKYYDLNEMSPFTQDRATQLAKQYLSTSTNENAEWTLTTEYMPIYTGDVLTLEGLKDNYGYGKAQKVFVKNRELDLATMTQKLTLKLASSNDTDTEE